MANFVKRAKAPVDIRFDQNGDPIIGIKEMQFLVAKYKELGLVEAAEKMEQKIKEVM